MSNLETPRVIYDINGKAVKTVIPQWLWDVNTKIFNEEEE